MKRIFYLLIGLVLLPTLLFAQVDYSGKGLYSFITTNYYDKTDTHSTAEIALLLADKSDTGAVALKADQTEVDSIEAALLADIANLAANYWTAAATKIYVDGTDEVLTGLYNAANAAITIINNNLATIETELNANTLWKTENKVYGFVDQTAGVLSYDDTTRTFTITGNFYVYINGERVMKTTESITHTAVTGTHYFYYNSAGTLATSTLPWGNDFSNVAQIAYAYYNAEKTTAPYGMLFNERHGMIMSTATHAYLHMTRGANSSYLFPLGSYSLRPASPSDAGNQWSMTGGVIYDEDLATTIADVPDAASYTTFWREGVDGDYTWSTNSVPLLYGTYLKFNELTGGSWTTTEVVANRYVNYYTAVTNATDATFSVIIFPGQAAYTSLATAQAENPIALQFGDVPFNEIIITNKITYRTGASYGSTGKCRIEAVESLAGVTIRLGSAVVATSHPALAGRSDPDQHPASSISADTTNFGGNLTGADDTVQKALDTLDNLSGLPATNAITKLYGDSDVVGTGTGEVWIKGTNGVTVTRTDNTLEIDANVDLSNYYTKAETNATVENYAYSKAQTNATIEAAIAAIPSSSQTVNITAGEDLTAGDVVSIINNFGSVTAVKNNLAVNTSPNGAESVFQSSATLYLTATAIDSTRFVVVYARTASSNPYAIVGTVSGSSIVWGTESSAFEAVDAYMTMTSCKIDTDKVLVCYQDATNTNSRMVVLTFSGSTITVGTPVNFRSGARCYYPSVTALDTDKAIVCYRETSGGTGRAKIITVSATVPTPYPDAATAGTEFNNAFSSYISVSALSSTSAIVAYQDGGNSNYGTSQILSISGTTITPGTEYVFKAAACREIATVATSGTKAVVSYRNTDTDTYGGFIVADMTGTAIAYGSELQYHSGQALRSSLAKIDSSKVLVAFEDANGHGYSNIATISTNTATFGTENKFNNAPSSGTNYISTCYLGNAKSAICYQDTDNSFYGTSVVNTWASASYDSVRGLCTSNVSSGQTASVIIKGVATGLSGLINGSDYFVNESFELQTTPVSLNGNFIKAGIANSTTSLILE